MTDDHCLAIYNVGSDPKENTVSMVPPLFPDGPFPRERCLPSRYLVMDVFTEPLPSNGHLFLAVVIRQLLPCANFSQYAYVHI
jgi:hypothetical protein